MDINRGFSIQDDNRLTWTPHTPARPNPTRPHIVSEGPGRPIWRGSMGIPANSFHGSASISNGVSTDVTTHFNSASVDQLPIQYDSWELAAVSRTNKAPGTTIDSYEQAMKENRWNSIPFGDLLALASAASPSEPPIEMSNAATPRYFPFLLPEFENNQLRSNPTNLRMEQNYSITRTSISNNLPHMPQCGFPVPYSSTYDLNSAPETMYDLNFSPDTIADAASNGNIEFQFVPVTPSKSSQMLLQQQQQHYSGAMATGNVPIECSSVIAGRDSGVLRSQHFNQFDVVSTGNSYIQCAPVTQDKWSKMQLLEALPNGDTLSQFAPLTPDKGSKMQHNQSSELINNFQDERMNEEMNQSQKDANFRGSNFLEPHSSQESCLESVVNSSPAALSTPSKENHQLVQGEENGIDLNKTPQQKPRKKKHRPRVVIEGKPKRTPKSTVKPNSAKGTERVKRKYVRRNVKSTSNGPSTDVAGEVDGVNQCDAVKSCKRSLNFDGEGQDNENPGKTIRHQEEMGQSNLNNTLQPFTFNNISQSQIPDLCTKNNDSTCTGTTTLHFSHGLDSLADVALNLNCSATQELDKYLSRPEITQQPTRRELLRENLNVLARDGHSLGTGGKSQNRGRKYQQEAQQQDLITESVLKNQQSPLSPRLQSSIQLVTNEQKNMNCGRHPQVAGNNQALMKRAHSQTIGGRPQFNLLGANYQESVRGNEHIRNVGMLFPEIYKKRRTEKIYNTTTASRSSVATVEDLQKEVTRQYIGKISPSQGNSSQDCIASTRLSPLQANNSQQCNPNSTENLRNAVGGHMHECCSLSLPSRHIQHLQTIPAEPLSSTEGPQNTTFDKLKPSPLMLTIRQTEMKTRKRSKAHTRVRDLASLTSVTQCNNLVSPLPKNAPTSQFSMQSLSPSVDNHAKTVISNHSRRKANGKMVSFSNKSDAALYGYQRYSANSRGSLDVIQQLNSPIDDLVQKLNCLSMNGDSNLVSKSEQKAIVPFMKDDQALVPFKKDDQMVPYEGMFDPTKKRKPRPKVDLDAETDRVWKLLMGKEASEDVEGTNAEKEKWWEEERRVFRGRADSFIARMHLIQGDRRFTRWNGSVLDSVIGVFLTQNVSDHLSSSAFMSLAARFPLKPTTNDKTHNEEAIKMYVEEPEAAVADTSNTRWQEIMPHESVISQDTQGSVTLYEVIEDKEVGHSSVSFESNTEGGCSSGSSDKEVGMCQEDPNTRVDILKNTTVCASFVEAEDGRLLEVDSPGISPQISVASSLFQATLEDMNANGKSIEVYRREAEDTAKNTGSSFIYMKDEAIRSCSDSNSEEEDPSTRSKPNGLNNPTGFVELLRTTMFREYYEPVNESFPLDLNKICCHQTEPGDSDKRSDRVMVNAESNSFSTLSSSSIFDHTQAPILQSSSSYMQNNPIACVLDVQCPELNGAQSGMSLASVAPIKKNKDVANMVSIDPTGETIRETVHQKMAMNAQAAPVDVPYSSSNNQWVHLNTSLEQETCLNMQPSSDENIQLNVSKTCLFEGTRTIEPGNLEGPTQRRNSGKHEGCLNTPNISGDTLDVVESRLLLEKKLSVESTEAESIMKEHVYSSKLTHEKTINSLKKNATLAKEKKKAVDWDYLRKEAYHKCGKRERTHDTMDSLDWEAVRCADVNEIAKAIKERGMNNMLAERIKDFLNRLVKEHEEISLEWLRDVPPDKAKEYLLSVRGLGLKSVECVRLLTLHQLAFPVDTNVGRIAVRLGWVPLQPLPESLQLHLLELYPILESIQKYLWPRLCTLDQQTLYELHYQLITFGKVFCTKSKPNCNACPMRAECKHFASAFASARLALPGPEEKGIVSSTVPTMPNQSPVVAINPMSLPPPEANILSITGTRITNNEPIVEVPASPEPESIPESDIDDIEDAFIEDPDEIPIIKLNIEDFALNLQNYMQENNMELQDGDVSKALVALNPEAASLPTPKLKNVSRLRTEHQVYELPDSHPLLNGVERRVPAEVCSYLLAIWTPGETAESIQPPEGCCSSQTSGNLCSEETCFSCNSVREANSQTVRGTLLIPCKTAMRGSFPLNGTYFQVNEVFADHESSLNPIDVPRAWLWNLPRRTVYFGTSIPTIFKGQSTEQIQSCFWRGYVCVRGFDQKTRAPRPLMARLHFPASKLVARARGKRDE